VRYSLLVDDLGFPLSKKIAREIAEDLYQKFHEGNGLEFEDHWVKWV